jgi:hypothetical protein
VRSEGTGDGRTFSRRYGATRRLLTNCPKGSGLSPLWRGRAGNDFRTDVSRLKKPTGTRARSLAHVAGCNRLPVHYPDWAAAEVPGCANGAAGRETPPCLSVLPSSRPRGPLPSIDNARHAPRLVIVGNIMSVLVFFKKAVIRPVADRRGPAARRDPWELGSSGGAQEGRVFPKMLAIFPFPKHREFRRKLLKYRYELPQDSRNRRQFWGIPIYFPNYREFALETGSYTTAHTTTQSSGLELPPA